MSSHPFRRTLLALALALALPVAHVQSVGSAFTYQGELRASGTPANAAYDFQFRLYNSPGGTTQLGAQVTANAVTVNNGLFSVPLDFGPAQFAGDAQWLEVSVRPAGSGPFETLSPRTAVTATPYALGAVAALANSVTTTSIVDGAIQFSDVNAAQFQARVTGTCTGSQGIQSIGANGTVVCGTFGGGGGTITGVTAGTGLTGGGTSGNVTIGIAAAGVGAAQVNADQVQRRVSGTCPTGQYVRIVNQDGTVVCGTDAGGASGWALTGNAGTNPATDFLGTTDAQPLVLRTGNAQSLRIEPSSLTAGSPAQPITSNVIAGSSANTVTAGVRGATISGGGIPANSDPNVSFDNPNVVSDVYGTIGGGYANTAGDSAGSVVDRPAATVAGGISNTASGGTSTVGGGQSNTASGNGATVAGGNGNNAPGSNSTISGGAGNTASGIDAVVAGGAQGRSLGSGSVVVGGGLNTARGDHAVAGGILSCAGGNRSWAFGRRAKARPGTALPADTAGACQGITNSGDADGDNGTFVWADDVDADFLSSGPNQFLVRATGGVGINTNHYLGEGFITMHLAPQPNNIRSNLWISGRNSGNGALSNSGVLLQAGGNAGVADSPFYITAFATLPASPFEIERRMLALEPNGGGAFGGTNNNGTVFPGTNSVAVGGNGNSVAGANAIVAGGERNSAAGNLSFAGGFRAEVRAQDPGAFVWADQVIDAPFTSNAANSFAVRSTGGARFVTGVGAGGVPTTGVQIGAGQGAWSSLSDRGVKSAIERIDVGEVLERLVDLPISSWSYTGTEAVRHIGPMAQDFFASFGLGDSERHISTIDADGIALAAIQGLNAKLEAENAALREEMAELREAVRALSSARD